MRIFARPTAFLSFVCLVVAGSVAGAVPITALTFSPDGAVLISNGDRCLEVRDPTTEAILRRIECDLKKITSLAFAPHGRILAVGGGDSGVEGEVVLLSWPEARVLHRLKDHTDVVSRVTFDVGGKLLAVASMDNLARLWRIEEAAAPTVAVTFKGHAGPVLAIGFSPSGGSLVTASADRSLKVWAAEDGRLLRSFGQHTESIHALAFRPHAATKEVPVACATGGDDRTVRVWQPEIGRMVRIVRRHEGSVLALVWSKDGSTLFSAGKEGVVRRIDGDSDGILEQWPVHDDWVYALAVSPDGTTLASGDWSGRIRVHDLRKREIPAEQSKQ